MSVRKGVLTGVQTKLLTIAGLIAEDVVIGHITAVQANRRKVMIVPQFDQRDHYDEDTLVRRTMTLVVGVVAVIDDVSPTSEMLQAIDSYEDVEAKMEELAKDPSAITGLDAVAEVGTMNVEGVNDNDYVVAITSQWELKFTRSMGSV